MSRKINDLDGNLPLPAEKMPKSWNEEERISSLFAAFRSKAVNEQDWISKYKFWQNLIYEWLKYNTTTSFSIADLSGAFKRKGCTPLCLHTVVEELLRNNEIMLESEFLKEPCQSWTSWSIDMLVKRPLSWSFSVVRSYIVNNEINRETRYIHLQIVRELGASVYSILEERKENILVPFPELVKNCKSKIDKKITDNIVMLVLIWLRRERKVVFRNSGNDNVLLVKVSVHSADNVTDIEEGLYKLMKHESELIKEIELMEEEKMKIICDAKVCVSKGLRQVAKTHLRKKKELENTIEKRANTLENLQGLIINIQNTHANTAVLSAYKTGTDVLKKFNESGLSESNVRDVMDDLTEALEYQKEVQSLLSESLKNDLSNTDLEEELAELMKSDEDVLPSVPTTELDNSCQELESRLKNLYVKETVTNSLPSEPLKNVQKKTMISKAEAI